MPIPEQSLEEALRNAKEEGKFQGMVLQSLQTIETVLKGMEAKHTQQDIKIDAKVDRSEISSFKMQFDDVKNKVYIAVGAVGFAEFAIGIYLVISR